MCHNIWSTSGFFILSPAFILFFFHALRLLLAMKKRTTLSTRDGQKPIELHSVKSGQVWK